MSADKFRDYVTGVSFALTLSHRMVEMLSQMDQYGFTWGYVTTGQALIERGLAERGKCSITGQPVFGITDAGRAVIPLLKLAGLYVVYPERPDPVFLPEPEVRLKSESQP